jgi:hypothetical protein
LFSRWMGSISGTNANFSLLAGKIRIRAGT